MNIKQAVLKIEGELSLHMRFIKQVFGEFDKFHNEMTTRVIFCL